MERNIQVTYLYTPHFTDKEVKREGKFVYLEMISCGCFKERLVRHSLYGRWGELALCEVFGNCLNEVRGRHEDGEGANNREE